MCPAATREDQLRVARVVTAPATLGVLVFVLELRTRAAIHLPPLGGVDLAHVPGRRGGAVCAPPAPRRAAGRVGGKMAAGTTMLAMNGSVSVIAIGHADLCGAARAGHNLPVASALMPLLDRLGMPRGLDRTGTEGLAAGTLPSEEWLRARPS